MLVRDKTYLKSHFKGKQIECPHKICPCLPCYNCHDCGYRMNGEWFPRFECAHKFAKGCPDELRQLTHVIRQDNVLKRTMKTQRTCLRCGERFFLKDENFIVNGGDHE